MPHCRKLSRVSDHLGNGRSAGESPRTLPSLCHQPQAQAHDEPLVSLVLAACLARKATSCYQLCVWLFSYPVQTPITHSHLLLPHQLSNPPTVPCPPLTLSHSLLPGQVCSPSGYVTGLSRYSSADSSWVSMSFPLITSVLTPWYPPDLFSNFNSE